MAMPSYKITKTQFREQYNVVEILTDKSKIMKQLQTFNSKNQAVAFGYRKKPGDDAPEWFKSYVKKADEKFNLIMQEIKDIKKRLDRNHIY